MKANTKTRCILLGLGEIEPPLTYIAVGIIEDGIEALCHPEINLYLSKAKEHLLMQVRPFLRKVSGIEGKVDRVTSIFNWFEFPFLEGLLTALGRSEAVSEGAIKYDKLHQAIE